jgi:pyruvate-formate lyase-activating enzyme
VEGRDCGEGALRVNQTVNIVFKSLYSCAHKCPFCHVLAVPRNVSYMSTAAVKATFDDIETLFAAQRVELELSGGEFTLRKDAIDLVTYLRTKRITWSSLVLDTMGVPLADEGLCRTLGAMFDKVNVSVHAPDAEHHALISASGTSFERLQTALANLFRFFPAVFTNTSICAYNYDRLEQIVDMILTARRAAPRTPLFCLFYLPVYREYGEALTENAWRIQSESNAGLLPPGDELPDVHAAFGRARARLADHGVIAVLRDFNVPACVYHAVSGSFPENAFGLANFMTHCYFTDYAHPITERHTLESVYPSMTARVKPDACGRCVAATVCPGIPDGWLARGYQVVPIDRAEYDREFPLRLLNQVLFAIVHDAVALRSALSALPIDWAATAAEFLRRLSNDAQDVETARERVRTMPLADRVDALIRCLGERGAPEAQLAVFLAGYRAMTAGSATCDTPIALTADA